MQTQSKIEMETKFKVGDLVRVKKTGQVKRIIAASNEAGELKYVCGDTDGTLHCSIFRESELEAYNPNNLPDDWDAEKVGEIHLGGAQANPPHDTAVLEVAYLVNIHETTNEID